jgi:hypothetical protein
MWTATFWVDGEMPHIIGERKLRHQAEFIAEQFVSRMTHPEIGVWWIEITEGESWDSESTERISQSEG